MSLPEFEEGTLLRIFVDEEDRHHGQPLYTAIVETLRAAGFPGATVFKGIEGYGGHGIVHAARVIDFSTNLPIMIEVIEKDEKIQAFLAQLGEIVSEGLITTERIRYARFTKGKS